MRTDKGSAGGAMMGSALVVLGIHYTGGTALEMAWCLSIGGLVLCAIDLVEGVAQRLWEDSDD